MQTESAKGTCVNNKLGLGAITLGLFAFAGMAMGQSASKGSQPRANGPQTSALTTAGPSPAVEALCRIQAKEAANLAFRSCINDNRSAEIEKIRQDYQEKLSQIKKDYEAELGKVSGKDGKKGNKKDAPIEGSKEISKDMSKDYENPLMKNAILSDTPNDTSDESLEKSEEAKEPETSGRREPTPMHLETAQAQPAEAAKTETLPTKTVKTKKTNDKMAGSSAFKNSSGKAILYSEFTEAPEPIPVESLNSATRR